MTTCDRCEKPGNLYEGRPEGGGTVQARFCAEHAESLGMPAKVGDTLGTVTRIE